MLTEQEFLEQREERLKILKNCGIYIIQNLVNGNIYIGSSINIRKRFSQHKSTLRHNTHRNKHLQNAWNKYGEENFEFIIIEHHSYPEKVLGRENKYIKLYNPEYNNILVNSEGRFFHSEETKRKIGIKSREKFIKNPELKQKLIDLHKGKPAWNKGKVNCMSIEQRLKQSDSIKKRGPISHSREIIDKIAAKNSIPIDQYDLDGNFIKTWKSAAEAARFYKASGSGNFSAAVKRGIKLYNSYWKKHVHNKEVFP